MSHKLKRRDRSFNANGKGDADRTSDVEAFRRNYDQIDWGPQYKQLQFKYPRGERGAVNLRK